VSPFTFLSLPLILFNKCHVPYPEWSGINALLYYGPTLVLAIGLSGETTTLFVAGGIGIVQLIAVLPAILFIDSVGRKKLLRGGSTVMASAHLGIAILVRSRFNAHSMKSLSDEGWLGVVGDTIPKRLVRAPPGGLDGSGMYLPFHVCVRRQLWSHRVGPP
jgi:hypothetical protein